MAGILEVKLEQQEKNYQVNHLQKHKKVSLVEELYNTNDLEGVRK